MTVETEDAAQSPAAAAPQTHEQRLLSAARRDDPRRVPGARMSRAERVLDAVALLGVLVSAFASRRQVRPLADETVRPLPGDELVDEAQAQWTHAITIHARPAHIWFWLVQMGCRRAGWYSYDGLDNGGIRSAQRIVPELQRVDIGDVFPMTPTADDAFVVRAVEHERALILGDAAGSATWAFFLLELADGTGTRVVTRVRGRFERLAVGLLFGLLWRPIHFGMQRRQLLNLKRLAEASA
jgi:hypothetical protein